MTGVQTCALPILYLHLSELLERLGRLAESKVCSERTTAINQVLWLDSGSKRQTYSKRYRVSAPPNILSFSYRRVPYVLFSFVLCGVNKTASLPTVSDIDNYYSHPIQDNRESGRSHQIAFRLLQRVPSSSLSVRYFWELLPLWIAQDFPRGTNLSAQFVMRKLWFQKRTCRTANSKPF